MPSMKRIQSVTIKRMTDDSPDTSYLGEYSNSPDGDYSIDREHSFDCPVNNPHISQPTIDKLERIIVYLNGIRRETGNDSDNPYYWGLDDACDLVAAAQDELAECDCGQHGDRERNQYRYFNPYENWAKDDSEQIKHECAISAYERMERLQHGDWQYIGIRAEAEIAVDGITQEITSGGLWGIESDSDESYLAEVEADELAELRKQLHTLGFSKRAIATACKQIEHKDGE